MVPRFDFSHLRIGPSASQVESAKLVEMQKKLEMAEAQLAAERAKNRPPALKPSLKSSTQPTLETDMFGEDGEDCEGGEEEQCETDEVVEPASSKPPPPSTALVKQPTLEGKVVNSSTHRKEWMALSRRMSSPDAATEFPNMSKLWNTSSKEPHLN